MLARATTRCVWGLRIDPLDERKQSPSTQAANVVSVSGRSGVTEASPGATVALPVAAATPTAKFCAASSSRTSSSWVEADLALPSVSPTRSPHSSIEQSSPYVCQGGAQRRHDHHDPPRARRRRPPHRGVVRARLGERCDTARFFLPHCHNDAPSWRPRHPSDVHPRTGDSDVASATE